MLYLSLIAFLTASFSLRLRTTDPMGYTEITTYDLAGNVLTACDKNGATAYYYYDIRNRLTGISKGNLNTTYTYDDAGRVLTEANESGTITYRYRYDGLLEEKIMLDTPPLGGK